MDDMDLLGSLAAPAAGPSAAAPSCTILPLSLFVFFIFILFYFYILMYFSMVAGADLMASLFGGAAAPAPVSGGSSGLADLLGLAVPSAVPSPSSVAAPSPFGGPSLAPAPVIAPSLAPAGPMAFPDIIAFSKDGITISFSFQKNPQNYAHTLVDFNFISSFSFLFFSLSISSLRLMYPFRVTAPILALMSLSKFLCQRYPLFFFFFFFLSSHSLSFSLSVHQIPSGTSISEGSSSKRAEQDCGASEAEQH